MQEYIANIMYMYHVTLSKHVNMPIGQLHNNIMITVIITCLFTKYSSIFSSSQYHYVSIACMQKVKRNFYEIADCTYRLDNVYKLVASYYSFK